jgi:hypothetical protein
MRRTGLASCPWELIRPDQPSGPLVPSHMPIVRAQMQARGMGQSGDVSGGADSAGGTVDTGDDTGGDQGGPSDQGGGAGSQAATGTSSASAPSGGGGTAPLPPPAATTVTPAATNWTPWIIGGATVIALGAIGYAMVHRHARRRHHLSRR